VNVLMPSLSEQHRHQVRSPIPAEASVLAALLVIGLSAAPPFGALYWLMRPAILPNPGTSAYRPPKPDPLVPLISHATRDTYALSVAAAKRENELLQLQPEAAFALAHDARPMPGGRNSSTIRQQKHPRGARQQDRSTPVPAPPPFNSLARDHPFATWYR
jgi:hypothetical protein